MTGVPRAVLDPRDAPEEGLGSRHTAPLEVRRGPRGTRHERQACDGGPPDRFGPPNGSLGGPEGAREEHRRSIGETYAHPPRTLDRFWVLICEECLGGSLWTEPICEECLGGPYGPSPFVRNVLVGPL